MEQEQEIKREISQEVAEGLFDDFLGYYGIKFSHIELEDGQAAAATLRNMLVDAIKDGLIDIQINESGLQVIHHLMFKTENNDSIIYRDKTVKANLAMDKITGKNKNTERQHAYMAALAGVPAVEFLNLRGVDATIFSRISTVFSMV
jgi:hypothetical protein